MASYVGSRSVQFSVFVPVAPEKIEASYLCDQVGLGLSLVTCPYTDSVICPEHRAICSTSSGEQLCLQGTTITFIILFFPLPLWPGEPSTSSNRPCPFVFSSLCSSCFSVSCALALDSHQLKCSFDGVQMCWQVKSLGSTVQVPGVVIAAGLATVSRLFSKLSVCLHTDTNTYILRQKSGLTGFLLKLFDLTSPALTMRNLLSDSWYDGITYLLYPMILNSVRVIPPPPPSTFVCVCVFFCPQDTYHWGYVVKVLCFSSLTFPVWLCYHSY